MLKHIVLYKLNEEGLKNLDKIKNNFLSMREKSTGFCRSNAARTC